MKHVLASARVACAEAGAGRAPRCPGAGGILGGWPSALRGADPAQLLPDGCGTGREGGSGAAGSGPACSPALCMALPPHPAPWPG